jgi:hypothetical protein
MNKNNMKYLFFVVLIIILIIILSLFFNKNNKENFDTTNLRSLLPENKTGEKLWLSIFPSLDPSSSVYKTKMCDKNTYTGRPVWAPGCSMWRSGNLNGLSNFLKAADKFPDFCNGPDRTKNLIELASFFGNVTQETSGLLYSAELGSTKDSLYGKGALQLTGALNYQMATMGVDEPNDALIGNTIKGGQIKDKCYSDGLDTSLLGDCYQTCINSEPQSTPKGSGFNVCKDPSIASSDSIAGWITSIWYWMNVPIQPYISTGFFNLQGDDAMIKSATAHNLIQNGDSYGCDTWCAVTAIAQIGCPSCCVGKQAPKSLDPMTINRIGSYVKIAGKLGIADAQEDKRNDYFCKLLNSCSAGTDHSTTCPNGFSYDNYEKNSGDGGENKICGNVEWTKEPTPKCVPVQGSNADSESCAKCQADRITWWPCNSQDLCVWENSPNPKPPKPTDICAPCGLDPGCVPNYASNDCWTYVSEKNCNSSGSDHTWCPGSFPDPDPDSKSNSKSKILFFVVAIPFFVVGFVMLFKVFKINKYHNYKYL